MEENKLNPQEFLFMMNMIFESNGKGIKITNWPVFVDWMAFLYKFKVVEIISKVKEW